MYQVIPPHLMPRTRLARVILVAIVLLVFPLPLCVRGAWWGVTEAMQSWRDLLDAMFQDMRDNPEEV